MLLLWRVRGLRLCSKTNDTPCVLLLSLTAVLASHLQLSIGRQISLAASGLLADKVKIHLVGLRLAPFEISPAPTSSSDVLAESMLFEKRTVK